MGLVRVKITDPLARSPARTIIFDHDAAIRAAAGHHRSGRRRAVTAAGVFNDVLRLVPGQAERRNHSYLGPVSGGRVGKHVRGRYLSSGKRGMRSAPGFRSRTRTQRPTRFSHP